MSNRKPYLKFISMMVLSFIVMYVVMFLNLFQFDHIYLSETRTYMALLMVAPMAVSMLLFMWDMYPNIKANLSIIGIAILVFVLALTGLRKQKYISDIAWMEAMIPHHSSALLTSTEAELKDAEMKKLAREIIKAQKKEIAEMKVMLKRLEK